MNPPMHNKIHARVLAPVWPYHFPGGAKRAFCPFALMPAYLSLSSFIGIQNRHWKTSIRKENSIVVYLMLKVRQPSYRLNYTRSFWGIPLKRFIAHFIITVPVPI